MSLPRFMHGVQLSYQRGLRVFTLGLAIEEGNETAVRHRGYRGAGA
jgi:hypothetical protein